MHFEDLEDTKSFEFLRYSKKRTNHKSLMNLRKITIFSVVLLQKNQI